jgi:hypothetical protein
MRALATELPRRWMMRYRKYGLAGLARNDRADRARPRAISPALQEILETLALQKATDADRRFASAPLSHHLGAHKTPFICLRFIPLPPAFVCDNVLYHTLDESDRGPLEMRLMTTEIIRSVSAIAP